MDNFVQNKLNDYIHNKMMFRHLSGYDFVYTWNFKDDNNTINAKLTIERSFKDFEIQSMDLDEMMELLHE